VALAHSERSAGRLRDAGVEVVEGQLFDAALIRQVTTGIDAILHLATRIPLSSEMPFRAAWDENDRIRVDGTRIVVDAAIANGVEAVVYPGIIFVYPDSGERWIDAATPVREPLSDSVRTALVAEAHVERFAQTGKRGVTLRLGLLYGPTSGHTQESIEAVLHGIYVTPGPDDAYLSSLWIDDAAAAIVAAMEQAPSGIYDVVDDEPLTQRELREVVMAATGQPLVEQTLDDLLTGAEVRPVTEQSRRVSNARFKERVGWLPTVRSPREGWQRLLQPVGV
ncbi:MAG TPA: NAD(P)-dependent oxidoreductase, partial [Thermomicrobiales bacterium]|nr:NAD(P)-dependent oxidoreductase [Thermomicrobiales bacterium]